jgi:hypothetical protein
LLGNSPGNLVRNSFPEGNGFGNTDTLRNNQSGKNMIYVVVHLPSAKQTKRNGSDVLACDVFGVVELFGFYFEFYDFWLKLRDEFTLERNIYIYLSVP